MSNNKKDDSVERLQSALYGKPDNRDPLQGALYGIKGDPVEKSFQDRSETDDQAQGGTTEGPRAKDEIPAGTYTPPRPDAAPFWQQAPEDQSQSDVYRTSQPGYNYVRTDRPSAQNAGEAYQNARQQASGGQTGGETGGTRSNEQGNASQESSYRSYAGPATQSGGGNTGGSYGSPYANGVRIVPPEIDHWNWGAFIFNIWWGIGNKAYLSLLCLVPCLNIVWIFICGAMGNKWAWEAGHYTDVGLFLKNQESWNRAGFVAFWVFIAILALTIFLMLFAAGVSWSLFDHALDFNNETYL